MSNNKKHLFFAFFSAFLLVVFFGSTGLAVEPGPQTDSNGIADVFIGQHGINWGMKVSYRELILTVSRPDGSFFQKKFKAGISPFLEISSEFMDGHYQYEIRLTPAAGRKILPEIDSGSRMQPPREAMFQSGSFRVRGGSIVTGAPPEDLAAPLDIIHNDDVIITGSLCVGYDCESGESFGDCTIKLNDHNLQICFEDISESPYPTNDWKIQVNDTSSGGADYFRIWDVDDGKKPFTIEAGAPDHALYVEDYGRVGLGTSVPAVELHIIDGSTPTIRLEQDTSESETAQTWDVAGDDTHFFIQDTTNSSKQPLRIQAGAPADALCLKSDGKVGIGTWSPAQAMELQVTGATATFLINRTDGARAKMTAGANGAQFGSQSNHYVRIFSNNTARMIIEEEGDVGIGNLDPGYLLCVGTSGAYCDGGAWVDGSSIRFKENIRELTDQDALDTLKNLRPVRFNYKTDKTEEFLGFISEEVPDLVATTDRKGMSPMDVVAVLTRVLQKQQATIKNIEAKIAALEKN